ncbi:MAG TPA: hypothetical protein VJ776_05145 [Thermoanaerobaculia bacterium]|nr:hypothetical protein [Thermoanaerobaculia bacterium]
MRGGRVRDTALASLFFLLATAVFTWPIAAHVTDGLGDLWDAKLNAWILHWDFHQAFRDPLHLYDANIFYPARYALAFSENLFGAALFAFPLYAAGVSTLAAYNAVFLLGMFLSAMAAWALARDVTGDPLAAALAGIVYAFCPWRIAQIPHIQFQWGAFLALALLFLLRYLDSGQRRDAVLFAVCLGWNALCNVHYALFSAFLVALVLSYEGLAARWKAFGPRLAGALAAVTAAGIVVFPLLLPYALASRLYGLERSTEEIGVFSGVWTDFLTAGGQNKLYAPLTQKWAKAEGELFPGIAVIILAAIALARLRGDRRSPAGRVPARRRRTATALDVLILGGLAIWIAASSGLTAIGPVKLREPGRIVVPLTVLALARLAVAFPRRSRFADLGDFLRGMWIEARRGLFLAIAVLGVGIALGTHTPYYRFLVQSFGPLFHVIRAPVRGVVLFDLGLAILAAWGLADLTRSRGRGWRLSAFAAAVLVIGLEYRAFPLEVARVDADPAPVYRWLAGVTLPGGVVEWPLGGDYDPEYEFRSTAHWKPILNGASGFAPPDYGELAGLLERRPIPEEVWPALDRRRATLLVFHSRAIDPGSQTAYADAVRRGMETDRLRLVRSFPDGEEHDFVFRLASTPGLSPPEAATTGPSAAERRLLEAVLRPPFGYIDSPEEGAAVEAGAWGFGWALDDSGIARILVSADGGAGSPAPIMGRPHPGVQETYPGYPDSERAGFGFSIPDLAPGLHGLTVTIVAKDGGRAILKRNIQVREPKGRPASDHAH